MGTIQFTIAHVDQDVSVRETSYEGVVPDISLVGDEDAHTVADPAVIARSYGRSLLGGM